MRSTKFSIIYFFVFLVCIASYAFSQIPPVAPVRPVVNDYHGTKITDPYRYMENIIDPEVQSWMKAQSEYTSSVLKRIPGRDNLFTRIQELEGASAARVRVVKRLPNRKIFFLKRMADENVFKLYMREGLSGTEKLLVDPEIFQKATGKPHAIDFYSPSHDGRYVAYGIAASGTEEASLYILETSTGQQIDQPIDRVLFGTKGWLPDESGFFYWRGQKLAPDAPPTDKYKNGKTYFHRLGTNPENDEVVFGNGVQGVEIRSTEIPVVFTYPGCNYALGIISTGLTSEFPALYLVPLLQIKGIKTPWKKIGGVEDKITNLTVHGDYLYLLTFKDAPRFKVIKTKLSDPRLETAEIVIAEGEAIVQNLAAAKDGLYVQIMDGGIGQLIRVPFDQNAKPEHINLPLNGSVQLAGTHAEVEGTLFTLTSWTKEPTIYQYNAATKTVTDIKLQPLGKFDAPDDLITTELKIRSYDGVLVPLSIIHKKGMRMDGKNPTLLEGYGAYGMSLDPYYKARFLAWFEKGGIWAVAHVRGGGEYGERWHMAGYKKTKPNTWKDFIACAEFLIKNKYTSPEYLAGLGASAGGITIGRALTERPDLFAVAILQVACLDMLRAETTSSGVPNIVEFGTVKDAEEFKALHGMSAFHHVIDGEKYPAVLLTQGVNDDAPWSSAKMAARLQTASSSGKPVLLRLDYESGHGVGDTKQQVQEEWADICAFILWQCGIKEFQP